MAVLQADEIESTVSMPASAGLNVPHAQHPLLDAVVAHSAPQPGQIVLGVLKALPSDTSPGQVHVALVGDICLHGSLLPLTPADLGQRVAVSMLNRESALLLGRVWEGLQSKVTEVLRHDQRPEHLTLEAQETLELRCGESAVVLHADGRIQLRGHYITSHASATQRIVGASVHVN